MGERERDANCGVVRRDAGKCIARLNWHGQAAIAAQWMRRGIVESHHVEVELEGRGGEERGVQFCRCAQWGLVRASHIPATTRTPTTDITTDPHGVVSVP